VVSSDHLKPGAVGWIQATVDTANKSGHMEKQITVYSNDRTNPMVSLSMSLDVVKPTVR
jgi:hypothetical protein